jgi:hypothetical protein
MRKGIGFWIGRIAAWFLAAGMVLSLPLSIAARDLGVVLFSQERMQSILQTRLVETGTLNRILAETLFGGKNLAVEADWYKRAMEHLSEPERQELLKLLLPSGWLDDQILSISDSFFNWLETDQPLPELSLDIRPLKAQLLGDGLDRAVEIIVDSWPSCSPEDVDMLQRAMDEGQELPMLICEPPEPIRGLIIDLAIRTLARETAAIPDHVPVLGSGSTDLQELQSMKQSLRSLRVFMTWSWLLPVAALGPIMALKIRSTDDIGQWWGLPLFFSGLTTLFFNLVLRGSRDEILSDVLRDVGSPESIPYQLIAGTIQSVANQALRLMLFHAVMLAIVGFGSWMILARIRKTSTSSAGKIQDEVYEAQVESRRDTPGSPPPIPPIDSKHDEGPPSGIFG